MKIELKNVKYSDFASHETHCFEASVYIDGKRAGIVFNDGQGGSNNYDSRALVEALKEHAKTLPRVRYEEHEFEQDADTLIGNLLMDHLYAKDLKRALSTRVLFVNKDGILKETKAFKKEDLANLLRSPTLTTRLESDKILNVMPFDVALSTYRSAVAAGV